MKVLPPPQTHRLVRTGDLCVTLLHSSSGLGSLEASPGEPTYDVIGELPLTGLYEEIEEPQGEEGQAVGWPRQVCLCSQLWKAGGGVQQVGTLGRGCACASEWLKLAASVSSPGG